MKHQNSYDLSTASNVLSIAASDIPRFMRKCISERSLSWVVAQLNRKMISGTDEERAEARDALRHLGFI